MAPRVPRAMLGGLVATLVTGGLAHAAKSLGLFRLSFPKLLGTMVTDGPGAPAIGAVLHLANGVGGAGAYLPALLLLPPELRVMGGAALGTAHSLVAAGLLAALPRLHPAPARAGLRPLRPLAYGPLTVPALVAGHALYGALIGRALRDEPAPPRAAASRTTP
jgi:hypothetical protein